MRLRLSLIILAAVITACAGCGTPDSDKAVEARKPSTTKTEQATTTEAAPIVASWPLTGLGATDALAVWHPAVSVKVDNHPKARPQVGLNQADVVWELRVEGTYTRFAAIYHTILPASVGPVRSGRQSDIDLVSQLNRPLFTWSGGNQGVTDEVHAANDAGLLTNMGFDVDPDDYHRDNSRAKPSNLFVDTASVGSKAPEGSGPPPMIFDYRTPGEALPPGAYPAAGVHLNYGGETIVDYVWDAALGGWARFETDERHRGTKRAHVDSDGVQIAPPNVVVLVTNYHTSEIDRNSPVAETVGTGEAMVLIDGAVIPAVWTRNAPTERYTLTTPDGTPVKLNPGRTWVALPSPGQVQVPITPEAGAELLASRTPA